MLGKTRDDVVKQLLCDKDGALIVRPSLQEAVLAGRVYSVANQAVVATTAGMATTWTGLGVANPLGSGKNLIMHEFSWVQYRNVQVDTEVGLMTSTHVGMADSLTKHNALDGSGVASVAYADAGATLTTTPVLVRIYASWGETDNYLALPTVIDLKGSLAIPPGRGVYTFTSGIQAGHVSFGFVWEEVDI